MSTRGTRASTPGSLPWQSAAPARALCPAPSLFPGAPLAVRIAGATSLPLQVEDRAIATECVPPRSDTRTD